MSVNPSVFQPRRVGALGLWSFLRLYVFLAVRCFLGGSQNRISHHLSLPLEMG